MCTQSTGGGVDTVIAIRMSRGVSNKQGLPGSMCVCVWGGGYVGVCMG
jgi:hypothetical protein